MVLKQDAGKKFVIDRPEKFGGKLEFSTYEEIEKVFVKKELHPLDLKIALAKEVNNLLKVFKDKKLEKISKDGYGE